MLTDIFFTIFLVFLNGFFVAAEFAIVKVRVSQIDLQTLSNNSCIIINACYLFASATLDLTGLATFINDLKAMYPFKPKYIFFQNPDYGDLNENYFEFIKN